MVHEYPSNSAVSKILKPVHDNQPQETMPSSKSTGLDSDSSDDIHDYMQCTAIT